VKPPLPIATEPAPARLVTYDVFVSYRRGPLDSRWAKWFSRALERYKLPRSLRGPVEARWRPLQVFRDMEEFVASPELQASIDDHLQRSRFLLVICSRATPESAWVTHEIAFFQRLGRSANILTVLVDGDPSSSFPPALFSSAQATEPHRTDHWPSDGERPLAADVRGVSPWWPSAVRRRALQSILAPVLGTPLRALQQRDSQRRRRRALIAAGGAAAILVIIGVLAVRLVLARNMAREQAARKDVVTYMRELPIADSLILRGQLDEARRALDDMPTAPRNWEWGYLRALCERELYTLEEPGRRTTIADGRHYLAFDRQGELGLWDAQAGRLLRRLGTLYAWSDVRHQPFWKRDEWGRPSIRVEPSNAAAMTPLARRRISQAVDKIHAYGDPVSEACLSPDGALIAARYGHYLNEEERSEPNDYTVYVWDIATGKLVMKLAEQDRPIDSIDFSPDGRRLLTRSRDHVARLWDVRSGLVVARLAAHTARLAGTAFSPDGAVILTTSDDGTVKIWANRAEQRAMALAESTSEGVELDNDDIEFPDPDLDVDVEENTVTLLDYDLPDPHVVKRFSGHTGDVMHAHFTADGERLLTVALDGTARVWDVASGAAEVIAVGGADTKTPAGHTEDLFAAALFDDSQRLVTAATDGLIKIWDTSSGRCLITIDWIGKERRARSDKDSYQTHIFELSRDRRFVAVAPLWNAGEPLQVWDLSSGTLVSSVQAPGWDFESASFSPDGSRLVTLTETVPEDSTTQIESRISVWDVGNAQILATLGLARNQYVELQPDAAGNTSALAERAAVEERIREGVAGGAVSELSFSRDGSAVLATVGGFAGDPDLRIWTWQALPPDLWHLGRSELATRLAAWKEQRLRWYLSTGQVDMPGISAKVGP
jgi:WD40 repeat protein